MVKVAGIWELGWNTPLVESWLWTFPLREFAVMDWAMTPVTGIKHNEQHSSMELIEYDTVTEMVEQFSGECVRVFVDENGETNLADLVHPVDAVYFFGCAGRSPTSLKQENDISVKIPTIANNGVMWPHQVLATILYDRLMKDGSNGN